jgi:CRISPR type I-E-associated protein CasB/Cse2
MSSPTQDYIKELGRLKSGDLGLLRTHTGQGLDESVDGFDLFAGIWWPLRQKNQFAPRREVAWLIAKLYAAIPLEHADSDECHLAKQLARCAPRKFESEGKPRKAFIRRFDKLLRTPLRHLEPDLQWALGQLRERGLKLNWVHLTDTLSQWERQSTRFYWATDFSKLLEGEYHAD